jgi:hypothetical protein
MNGYNPIRFVELLGGEIVETLNAPPDPATYRDNYYYNSRQNRLFRRLFVKNEPENGLVIAVWRPISEIS